MSGQGFLRLLRLADSGLPVGAFAHSGGIEALARAGVVSDAGGLISTLRAYRALSLDRFDAWFARAAHRAAANRARVTLTRLSDEEIAARPARAQRSASLRTGRAALRLAGAMAASDEERADLEWVVAALSGQTPWATVLGSISATLGIEEDDAAGAAVYSAVAAQVTAAVRLGLLGADASQGVLVSVLEGTTLGRDGRRSSFAPLIDMAQMEHESLGERHFAS